MWTRKKAEGIRDRLHQEIKRTEMEAGKSFHAVLPGLILDDRQDPELRLEGFRLLWEIFSGRNINNPFDNLEVGNEYES